MRATALELKDIENDKIIIITLDEDKVNPSWKIGDVVRIDLDDTGTIPETLHGTFEIRRGLNMDITNLDEE